MGLSTDQKNALKEMRGVVESYKTLGVGSAHRLRRLARRHFSEEIDIRPAIAAVKSRRGDLIYAELSRLGKTVDEIEKRAAK